MPELPGSQIPSEDASLGRPAKRKRVALACESCRDRKVRCDGGKPVCRPCSKRAECTAPCVYSVISNSAKQVSEQEYIASLRRQVNDLNQVIDTLGSSGQDGDDGGASFQGAASPPLPLQSPAPQVIASASPSRRLRPRLPPGDPIQASASSTATVSPCPSVTRVRGHHDGNVPTVDDPSPVNAMGASMAVHSPGAPLQDAEYYGQSSVHSLLQHVPGSGQRQAGAMNAMGGLRSLERQSRPQQQQQQQRGSRALPSERPDALLQPEYALPPRRTANALLDLYFDNLHIFYPWVHSVSFRAQFDALWELDGQVDGPPTGDIGIGGDKCPPRTFYCALNAMFALGCEFSDFPDRQAASAAFYARARGLLDGQILDHSSISLLQVLLLVSHYLLTTQYPTSCYNMIGLACRMAVGLGLHLDKTGPRRSKLEIQMRRRLWHGCFQMDMFVSMTLGRPPSVMANNDIPLPDTVDDVYLQAHGEGPYQPADLPSQNTFMVINIKLMKILGLVLSRIYFPAQQQHAQSQGELPEVNTLMHLDALLQEAKRELPAPLDWDRPPPLDSEPISDRHRIFRRQANVLAARWLHLRVLLYRPSFTSFCEAARPPPSRREQSIQLDPQGLIVFENELESVVRSQCAELCVKYACDLVESVARATSEAATGAWWFSLFYLITSGVIIVLAECTRIQKRTFDGPALARAWELCSATLQRLGADHERAREYLQSLQILRERTLQSYVDASDHLPLTTAHPRAGAAAEDPLASRPEQHHLQHPQQQVDEYYGTFDDASWNNNVVSGTGFFEHDWGAPFLFENLGEDWLEGSFPLQGGDGGLQGHI